MFAATVVYLPLLLAVPDKERVEPESKSWVGKNVISVGVGLHIGNLNERDELIPPLTPLLGLDYRVYGERGDFVQLKTRQAVMGWIDKKKVMLIEDGIAHFTKQLQANPHDLTALNHRAWAWSLKGEHLLGIKDLTDAIGIAPETSFYNNRARIWVRHGDLDKALADYEAALQMDQGGYVPQYNRGACWHLKKDYDRAIADFDRALELNPNYVNAFVHRGISWHARREYDKAIADCTQALRVDPKSVAALTERGNAWLAKGDRAKARSDFDEAIRIDARYEQAYCYRARAWDGQKETDKALDDFAEAIRLNPRYSLAFQGRAEIWVRQKEYAKAHADFERVWRYDARNADACAAFAFFLATCPEAKLRDGKNALALARQAQELEKTNTNALSALAAAHAELGNFAEAIRVQQQALEDPQLKNDADARRRLELYRKKQTYRQE